MTQEIKKNIFSVGAIDPNRKVFDALIPLPNGTSYNSYLIKDEKTALIDTVDPNFSKTLLDNLKSLNIEKIDYIIVNHAEQDHSGSLPIILEKYPESKVICSEKCKQLLMDLLNIPDNKIITVKDKETLSLGNKTLEFIYTPWVHWPETMCTYVKEDKILFSCDFFGAHMSDEDLLNYDEKLLEMSSKRYFAEIMAPFRPFIKKNLETVNAYQIEMITPSHGAIHKNPNKIIELYQAWSSDDTKNLAIITYVSMHGSTKTMAEYLAKELKNKGVNVKVYNLENADLGELSIDLLDASTVVVGSPCFHIGIHPSLAYSIYLVNSLRPKTKFLSIIGSYGWAGKIVDEITPMIKNIKAEIISPVIVKGVPKKNDFISLTNLAEQIKNKMNIK